MPGGGASAASCLVLLRALADYGDDDRPVDHPSPRLIMALDAAFPPGTKDDDDDEITATTAAAGMGSSYLEDVSRRLLTR